MRTYVVRAGDSPASIAAQDHHAACPKCSVDLIRANPEKKTVRYPNGFVTFKDLRVGEVLRLPEKWFNGELDQMPNSYFAALPYADGVTPGVGQAPGPDVIGSAKAAVAAIVADPNYCTSVAQSGSPVNTAIHAFKTAWNADNPNFPCRSVPACTSYRPLTRSPGARQETVAARVRAGTPSGRAGPATVTAVVEKKGLSTGAVLGIGLVAAVTVGAITYAVTRNQAKAAPVIDKPIEGHVTDARPHPAGRKGALLSLNECAERAWKARMSPRLRAWALKQFAEAGVSHGDASQMGAGHPRRLQEGRPVRERPGDGRVHGDARSAPLSRRGRTLHDGRGLRRSRYFTDSP